MSSIFIPAKEILSHSYNLNAATEKNNVRFDDTYLDIINAAKINISAGRNSASKEAMLKIIEKMTQGTVRCIDSILEQTFKDIELILIDDGSTDGSELICDRYKSNNTVKVIHQENRGVSSARNRGLEVATGTYVAFVDSDDYLEKNMLQQMLGGLASSDLVMCGYYKENKRYQGVTERKIVNKVDAMMNVMQNDGFKGFLWNKLFKRSIIEKNKLMFSDNIHMCEDLLYCAKYINVCNPV